MGILQGNVASSHRETSCTWTPYICTLHLLQHPIPAPDIPGTSQLHIANRAYQLPFQVTNSSFFLSFGVKVKNKVSYLMIWHWSWKKKSERFQKFMVFPCFMGCKELNGWADARKEKLGYSVEWTQRKTQDWLENSSPSPHSRRELGLWVRTVMVTAVLTGNECGGCRSEKKIMNFLWMEKVISQDVLRTSWLEKRKLMVAVKTLMLKSSVAMNLL